MRKKILSLFIVNIVMSMASVHAETIESCQNMLQKSPAAIQAGCAFDVYAVSGAENVYCNAKITSCRPSEPFLAFWCTNGGTHDAYDCNQVMYCGNIKPPAGMMMREIQTGSCTSIPRPILSFG